MSHLDSIRSLANQAGQTMTLVAAVGKEKATRAASVGKEKGLKAYAHAAVAASAGRSTLENRLKQVQTSSTYQNVKQRLWSKSSSGSSQPTDSVHFASTEKEYYKVDPSKVVVQRSNSSRRVNKSQPSLKRSAKSVETSRVPSRDLVATEVEF
ncbi:unnamed protein product [Aphanomyces euteiches]